MGTKINDRLMAFFVSVGVFALNEQNDFDAGFLKLFCEIFFIITK